MAGSGAYVRAEPVKLAEASLPKNVFSIAGEARAYLAKGSKGESGQAVISVTALQKQLGNFKTVRVFAFDAKGRKAGVSEVKVSSEGGITLVATAGYQYLIYPELNEWLRPTYGVLCRLSKLQLPTEVMRGACTEILCGDQPFRASDLGRRVPGLERYVSGDALGNEPIGGFDRDGGGRTPSLPSGGTICDQCMPEGVFYPAQDCNDVVLPDPAEPAANCNIPPLPAKVAEVMTKALCERDSLPAAVGSLWRFEGPTDLKRDNRVDSGRINEIAIDRTTPETMYVTGATGGVWKTVDGGITWAARSQGWPIQAATAVAIDPNDPNRVFVGTGDYKRLDLVEPFSVGIMRSVDGGLTWSNVGSKEMREFTVSRIVFCNSPVILTDPKTGRTTTTTLIQQVILAATGRGSRLPGGHIFRSTDGGDTWAKVDLPDANWDDLESCSGTLWASATQRHNLDDAVGNNETGLLYKSTNGGRSWTKISLVTPGFVLDDPNSRPDTIQIACEPKSEKVYVAVYENSVADVFFTSNAGTDWSELTATQNNPVPVGNHPWGHAAFGVTASFVYVGGVRMYRLPTSIPGAGFNTIPASPGPDFQCVVAHPINTEDVFLCNDAGIYRNSPESPFRTDLNKTLGVTQIFRMDVHPRNGNWIAIGSQDNGCGVNFYMNGNDWAAPPRWKKLLFGDSQGAAFRGDNTPKVYQSNPYYTISRYDGFAEAQTLLLENGASSRKTLGKYAKSPLLYSNDKLYSARNAFSRLLNPEDNDLTSAEWDSFEFFSTQPDDIQSLAFCPTDTQVIYAGSIIGELFYSTNGGEAWTNLAETGLPPNVPIWAISPSSANCLDALVAVGYEGGISGSVRYGNDNFHAGARLFRKADVLAAGDWSERHGKPPLPHAPLYAIARVPSKPDSKWFVAGDVGVFRTEDGGDHWANATAPLGLPNTLVRDLRLSGDGNTLYAATFGRGVWSMDVDPPPDHFGVRGTVTKRGGPVSGIMVKASGPGRIKKFLKNTLMSVTAARTAPIEVTQTAIISNATASLTAINAGSASLVTPSGAELEMSRTRITGDEFSLTKASAEKLQKQPTKGNWRFKLARKPRKGTTRSPSVVSGFVDFNFQEGISGVTGQDGEYTLEYLGKGMHDISIGDSKCEPQFGAASCQYSIAIESNTTGLDFRQK